MNRVNDLNRTADTFSKYRNQKILVSMTVPLLTGIVVSTGLVFLGGFNGLQSDSFFGQAARAQTGASLSPELFVYPRHAGKPDPRWRDFDWRFLDRDASGVKYRLFFDSAEERVAAVSLPMIDEQIQILASRFGGAPKATFDYVLFTSLEEFRQANIFFVEEGVQGITSTTEATMALPYTGDPEEFRHVSTHEMTHQFQVQKAFENSGLGPDSPLARIPLWFIEGMAEYESRVGLDFEMHAYIRDLLFNANNEEKYRIPRLFEDGQMSFIFVYKVGQSKVDFFDRTFGAGAAQRIFAAVLADRTSRTFEQIVAQTLVRSVEDLEKMWRDFLEREYVAPRDSDSSERKAPLFEEISAAGSYLDLFDVSPDGSALAIREVDPLTGVSSIRLMDASDGSKRIEVLRDHDGDVAGLSFFQAPTLALSDRDIAVIVQTPHGPAFQIRSYHRTEEGFRLGEPLRVSLNEPSLYAAANPTFNASGSQIAFTALHPDGTQSVRILDLSSSSIKEVTRDHYAWRSLAWTMNSVGREILIGSTNRADPFLFQLYRFDPHIGEFERIGVSGVHQLAASASAAAGRGEQEEIVFRSSASGSPQIHLLNEQGERRITDVLTMADHPVLRGDWLYFLILRSGRLRLVRLARNQFDEKEAPTRPFIPSSSGPAWTPILAPIMTSDAKTYRPFYTSGWRVDNVGAYLSGNSSGLSVQASDLMRNYQVGAWLVSPDNPDQGLAQISFSSRRGRSNWSAGIFRSNQWRATDPFAENQSGGLGSIGSSSDPSETATDQSTPYYYRHQEWGVLGAYEYPLSLFSRVGIGGRVSSVSRANFDSSIPWTLSRPQDDFLISPSVWYGIDRVSYESVTGPIDGSSFLVEAGAAWTSGRSETYQKIRADAAVYRHFFETRTVLGLEGIVGSVVGSGDRDPFFIWSDDILRAYDFGDRRLLGEIVAALKVELKFPVGSAFNFPYLRGLAAYDYGSVAREWSRLLDNRSSSISFGLSLNFPPFGIEVVRAFTQRRAPWTDSQVTEPAGNPLHVRITYLYE